MGRASEACTKEERQENIGNILIRLILLKLRFNYPILKEEDLANAAVQRFAHRRPPG